jgi:hypothetical protein
MHQFGMKEIMWAHQKNAFSYFAAQPKGMQVASQ